MQEFSYTRYEVDHFDGRKSLHPRSRHLDFKCGKALMATMGTWSASGFRLIAETNLSPFISPNLVAALFPDNHRNLLARRDVVTGLKLWQVFVEVEPDTEVGELPGMLLIATTHSKTYNGLLAGGQ
jgi:hypothetical protein